MSGWQIFKVSRRTFFNPSAWLDVDAIRDNTRLVFSSMRGLFTIPTPEHTETFDEAMQRLGVTELDIEQREKSYQMYTWLFLAIGIAIFLFSFYLLIFHASFAGWLIGLAAAAYSLTQAFRFSFWAFQIKHRKLGCTFAEWRQGRVKS